MGRNFGSPWSLINNKSYNKVGNFSNSNLGNNYVNNFDDIDNQNYAKLDDASSIILSWREKLLDKIKNQEEYVNYEKSILDTYDAKIKRELDRLKNGHLSFSSKKRRSRSKKRKSSSKKRRSNKRRSNRNKFRKGRSFGYLSLHMGEIARNAMAAV